jgi:thiol-disulfide isomerase/thioredoxin
MITFSNSPVRLAVLLTLSAAVSTACGREAGPGSARKPAGSAAAAAAAGTAPAVAVEGPSNPRQPQPAEAPGALTHATAEQLLAAIKASGKKGTIVNAWASWCGPCRREVPMLQALATNLKPQGVEIVLVSVDEAKDEAKAQSFLKDNAITLKSYLVEGSVADFKEGINPNWPGMLPASFLFDRTARLVHFWGGEAFENEIVPVVESFVAGRAIDAETRYGLAPGKVE